jgi:hypothetical protein
MNYNHDYTPGYYRPFIRWHYIDGPVLICSDGTVHWLSLIEIICLKLKIKTIADLDMKYNKCNDTFNL